MPQNFEKHSPISLEKGLRHQRSWCRWDASCQHQLQNNQNSVAWANQLHSKRAQEQVYNLDGLLMLSKTHPTFPEEFELEELFLCASQVWVGEGMVARSAKSVAYVTNNKRLCATFCTVEALSTDRHETSRGLFATAELLVKSTDWTNWQQ